MDKQLKTEIRKLLTGRTIRDEEGWLIAVPEGNYMIYHGVADRSGFRKIKRRQVHLQVAASNEAAFQPILEALQDMGNLVNMQTKPEALCALCRFFLTKAVLLCVSPEENGCVLVQTYTGRSLMAGISSRLAIRKLKKKVKQEQAD
jgi:hypothetical protein